MEYLFYIGRPLLLGILALFLTRYIGPYTKGLIRLSGRINRLQFSIGIIILSIAMHLTHNLIHALLVSVVILPAYYAIQLLESTLLILLMVGYYSIYVRRLNDLAFPGFFVGILWTMFLIFTTSFEAVKNKDFMFSVIILIVNLTLCLVPGTERQNAYGKPSLWPRVGLQPAHKQINHYEKPSS